MTYIIATGDGRYWTPDGWSADRPKAVEYPTVAEAARQMRAFLRTSIPADAGGVHVCRVEADGTLTRV